MPNRPYSVLSKGERNALDLLDTDALLAHYEDVYASRFRWEGGPEGMDPSWPERMIYRYGLLGVAEAFGEQQLAGGSIGLRGIYEQPLNWFPHCDGTSIPEGWTKAHEGPTVYVPFVPRSETEPLCQIMAEAKKESEDIIRARNIVREVYMDEKIERYIVDIVYATRTPEEYGLKGLKDLISYGGSPRASISLSAAAKAYAFIKRRGYVIPEDVRAVCPEVLRHRIGLTYEAEAENVTTEEIISQVINAVVVP